MGEDDATDVLWKNTRKLKCMRVVYFLLTFLSTEMSKKVKTRLREFGHAARGSQYAGSCNLAVTSFDMSVLSALSKNFTHHFTYTLLTHF